MTLYGRNADSRAGHQVAARLADSARLAPVSRAEAWLAGAALLAVGVAVCAGCTSGRASSLAR
jgi:hypothetical protein